MQNIKTDALVTIDQLRLVAVRTDADLMVADQLVQGGRDMIEQIRASFDPTIEAAHKAHKQAITSRDEKLKPWEEAVKAVKGLMADYKAERERQARAEALKLEAEARKREEERKLAEAIAVAEAGDTDGADAIMEERITVPPVFVPPAPKTETRFREVWKFRVLDIALVPRQFLQPDDKKIGLYVRAMKGAANIPGVEVYSEKV